MKNRKAFSSVKLLILLILAVISLLNVTFAAEKKFYNNFVTHKEVKVVNGIIVLNKNDFNDGFARFYKIKLPEATIYFFILKSNDGLIRAAFDACDSCFPRRKGYRQDGDNMICNLCGQAFASNQINIKRGACNPSPLNIKVSDNSVIISLQEIKQGIRFFV